MTTFYLGTHMPNWLEQTAVPLFLSDVRLRQRRSLPRARGPWALDSGGFSELAKHGRWTVPPASYVANVRRYQAEIGGLAWAAIQDWMCEDVMLKKTGLTVREHQARTVASYLELRSLAPEISWTPVLQGFLLGDYLDHAEDYQRAGVDLLALPVVGVGSICRRQATFPAQRILRHLAGDGLRLHGFGLKKDGLAAIGHLLASADSMAWSKVYRHEPPLPGHDKPGQGRRTGHINCANCLEAAQLWHGELLERFQGRAA